MARRGLSSLMGLLLASGLMTMGLLVGCSPNSPNTGSRDMKPQWGQPDELFSALNPTDRALQKISVVGSDGLPLTGAEILIGSDVNDPFVGNLLTTDALGATALPAGWTSAQPVTIDAPGYVRVTFLNLTPQGFSHKMKRVEFAPTHKLKGHTLNHVMRDFDGKADFGLIFKALSKEDLFNLQLSSVISPETDKISIAGFDVEMPSNLTLPRQKERYILIPITLDKPEFRFYFDQPGNYLLMGAKGRFPFTEVVNQMQSGKEMHKLINKFEFMGGSVKSVNVSGPETTFDFDVAEINFTQTDTVKFPAPGTGRSILGGRLMEWSPNQFLPTDIKLIEAAGDVSLHRGPNRPHHLVGVLKNSNEFEEQNPGVDRLSASLVDDTTTPDFKFLSLLDNPIATDLQSVKMPNVTIPFTPAELIVYASVGKVIETETEANVVVKTYLKSWEVYSTEMISEIKLPRWKPLTKEGLSRWEAMYAVSREASLTTSHRSLDNMTHVTRSSVDF